jgi:type IV pilus assembly protein PilM
MRGTTRAPRARRLLAGAGVPWWRPRDGARRFHAIDVGSHSVKLVAVHRGAERVRVEGVALGELPAGVVHGHVVRHPAPVADTIRSLVRQAGGRTRLVITAVPAPAVMVRRLVVPTAAGASLAAAVVREAAALIPDTLDQAVLDYQVLGPPRADGALEVLVVAARRDVVQSYTSAIRAAGLPPPLVDVDVFALDRLHRLNHDGAGATPIALVHVGARAAAITVVQGDRSEFVGDVPAGGPGADVESLAQDTRRALDLFCPDAAAPLAGMVLSGGAAGTPGLSEALGRRFACPVAIADPFRHLALGPRVDRALLQRFAPALAVAAGLAVRPLGEPAGDR